MTIEAPGARLKRMRLEKGLSLEDAHKGTKIHLNVLRSIEEGNLINLDPVYLKGFLKIYCKFLGVNVPEFISDYKPLQQKTQPDPKIKEEKLKPSPEKSGNLKPRLNLNIFPILIAIIVFVVLSANIKKIFDKEGQKKNSSNLKLISPEKEKLRAVKPAQKTTKSVQKDTLVQKSQIPASTVIRLGIRARDDCFINLKADGKVVFQGILKKGRFESWQAKDKIELSLGNAGVVDLEVNGKLISNLGKKGQTVRDILITKEGLSVGR
ncbi:MAG: RodZ domain-containing protein [Candidatus Omnitrophota bacterium]